MKHLFLVITSVFISFHIFSQNIICDSAMIYCGFGTYNLNTNTPSEQGPNYGCMTNYNNPKWFFFEVDGCGNISIELNSATYNDIDFACWGPFSTPSSPCTEQLTANCSNCLSYFQSPDIYPSGSLVDCSYSPGTTETIHISNAQSGQYYIFCVTNYSGSAGTVSIEQVYPSGCQNNATFYCPMAIEYYGIDSICIDSVVCNGINNEYNIHGTVYFYGMNYTNHSKYLEISHSPSNSYLVYNEIPYNPGNNLTFTIPNVYFNGNTGSVKASFSDSYYEFEVPVPKPAFPDLSINYSYPDCGLSNGAINAVVVNAGGGLLSFEWSNGIVLPFSSDSTSTISGLESSLYSLIVSSSNGCVVENMLPLKNNNMPDIQLQNISSPKCPDYCNAFASAVVMMSPPFNYTLAWSNGLVNQISGSPVTNGLLCPGINTITLSDNFGCNSYSSAYIYNKEPITILPLANYNPSCYNQQNGFISHLAVGGTPPYQYMLNNGNWSEHHSFYNLSYGIYTYNVKDSFGCISSIIDTLINPLPIEVIFTSNGINSCSFSNGTINVSANLVNNKYCWSHGVTYTSSQLSHSISGLTPDYYTVTVTHAPNSCSEVFNIDLHYFTVDIPLIEPSCNFSCSGLADIIINGNSIPPYTVEVVNQYTDTFLTSSFTISDLCKGEKEIIITDSTGCSVPFYINVPYVLNPSCYYNFNVVQNVVTFSGSQQNSDSVLWDFDDGTYSSDINPVHTYLQNGNYTVCLYAFNKCDTAMHCKTVPITSVAIQTYNTQNFSIYPNPASDFLFIVNNTKFEKSYSVVLYNTIGQVVYKKESLSGIHLIPIVQLVDGMYYIRIETIEGLETIKVVIER